MAKNVMGDRYEKLYTFSNIDGRHQSCLQEAPPIPDYYKQSDEHMWNLTVGAVGGNKQKRKKKKTRRKKKKKKNRSRKK